MTSPGLVLGRVEVVYMVKGAEPVSRLMGNGLRTVRAEELHVHIYPRLRKLEPVTVWVSIKGQSILRSGALSYTREVAFELNDVELPAWAKTAARWAVLEHGKGVE